MLDMTAETASRLVNVLCLEGVRTLAPGLRAMLDRAALRQRGHGVIPRLALPRP